jgi:hypothetical protein
VSSEPRRGAVAGFSLFSEIHEPPEENDERKMSEWVLHCAVDQRLVRRSQPTRDTALEDACLQLLQGHVVNRIIGPSETINAHKIKEWRQSIVPSHNREAARKPERVLLAPQICRVTKTAAQLTAMHGGIREELAAGITLKQAKIDSL